jgi:hypothetical protein
MNLSKLKMWAAGLLVLGLVGCGGGGGASGTPLAGGITSTQAVADVQIKFSSRSIDNSGTQTNTATVTVVDSNGRGISGATVAFKVDNNGTYAIANAGASTTAADGTLVAVLTAGSDATVRSISLTATAGSVSKSASFDVVGSNIAAADVILTVPSSIQNSVANVVTVIATAVDANRNALPNIPLTLSVDNGATFLPSGSVTSSAGVVSGTLSIGSDQANRTITVTATSGSIKVKKQVSVVGSKLSPSGFTSTVAPGSTNRVTYVLLDNTGAKMVGYDVSVTASGIQNSTQVGKTNADGEFQYSYSVPAVADANATPPVTVPVSIILDAVAANAPSSETIVVSSGVIATVTDEIQSASVAASPSVVLINQVGASSLNKVEVRALFVGDKNQPIKNVRARFDLGNDPNNIKGTFGTSEVQYSDVNGIARTTYAPAARFSPLDGVVLRVCYDTHDFDANLCPKFTTTTLTVISDSLSVSIGTDRILIDGDLTYSQNFVVQVVDSAGQAKAGVKVSPSLDLVQYYKGSFVRGAAGWIQNVTASCENEDLNRNGVLEKVSSGSALPVLSEDVNQNGSLDPRKADVAISLLGSDTTDVNGIVKLKIQYARNIGGWLRYKILVAASGIAGTEGRASFTDDLGFSALAANKLDAIPPFILSPYGVQASPTVVITNAAGQSGKLCTNPN